MSQLFRQPASVFVTALFALLPVAAGAQTTTPPAQTPTPVPAQTPAPAAADTTAKPTPEWVYGGLLDLYFQYDFNKPRNGAPVTARNFDPKQDSFTLAEGQVRLTHNSTDKIPVGLTAILTFGHNSDLLHATEPAGISRYRNIQQLYGTYLFKGAMPTSIDYGIYPAWIGYESLTSTDNDNYSRGFNYTLGQPSYANGLRVTHTFSPHANGIVYLVNGWNEIEDGNGNKTAGATLNLGTDKPLALTFNYWGGAEGSSNVNGSGSYGGIGFPNQNTLRTNIGNIIAVYNVKGTKFAVDAYYTDASSKNHNSPGGKWNGVSVYGRRQFNASKAGVIRLERFEDRGGLRTGLSGNHQLHSVTGTFEFVTAGIIVNRLEYRADFADTNFFFGNSNLKKKQNTLTLATAVKFY